MSKMMWLLKGKNGESLQLLHNWGENEQDNVTIERQKWLNHFNYCTNEVKISKIMSLFAGQNGWMTSIIAQMRVIFPNNQYHLNYQEPMKWSPLIWIKLNSCHCTKKGGINTEGVSNKKINQQNKNLACQIHTKTFSFIFGFFRIRTSHLKKKIITQMWTKNETYTYVGDFFLPRETVSSTHWKKRFQKTNILICSIEWHEREYAVAIILPTKASVEEAFAYVGYKWQTMLVFWKHFFQWVEDTRFSGQKSFLPYMGDFLKGVTRKLNFVRLYFRLHFPYKLKYVKRIQLTYSKILFMCMYACNPHLKNVILYVTNPF